MQLDNDTLAGVLNDVYGSGWAFGADDALADLNPNVGLDWDAWQAGNEAAAALLDPPAGLQNMLMQSNIVLKGISDTTMDRIGSALALSLSQGLGARETAKAINYVINDPARALTIARTETARALVQSNLSEYTMAGIKQVEWLVADPCPICAQNSGVKVPIGESFPSGATLPPAHPNCVCDIAPVSEFDDNPIGQGRVLNDGDYVPKPDLNDLASDNNWNIDYYNARVSNAGDVGTGGLKTLASTYDRYGYHDKPLVSATEFARLKDKGEVVLYRGLKDADTAKVDQMVERFKTGETHWAGQGVYGNGSYASTVRDRALAFADQIEKNTFEMVLRPEAKVIEHRELEKLIFKAKTDLREEYEAAIQAVKDQMIAEGDTGIAELGRRTQSLDLNYKAAVEALDADSSVYAISRGYDAVVMEPSGAYADELYYIILNRSAVVVNG